MRAALSSDKRIAEPMLAALRKGNAVDAIVCGLFVAAALERSVLMGPAQILIGGTGAGMRAIDGRARQPGLGAKRPRGWVEGDAIPDTARIAVPGLPAAAMLAHATFGSAALSAITSVVKPIAKDTSRPRAKIIERIFGGGAAALAKIDELRLATKSIFGGLLSAADLEGVRPRDMKCAVEDDIGRAPWERGPDRPVEILAASDTRGLVAVACYEVPLDGLAIEGTDLVAPLLAEPVRRGVPRVRPGEPLPAPTPLALIAPATGIAAKTEAALEEALEEIRTKSAPKKDVLVVAGGALRGGRP